MRTRLPNEVTSKYLLYPLDRVVVVVGGGREEHGRKLVPEADWSKVGDVCAGGERRQDSVAAGLKRLGKCEWVVIHDGARPLVTAALIERGLEAARETGARRPGQPPGRRRPHRVL